MILLIESFDYADALNVLLYDIVELIICFEYPLENRIDTAHYEEEPNCKYRYRDEKNERDVLADTEGDDY